MSKRNRMPRNGQMYNRQTKGYQQNMMKSLPESLEAPKMPSRKKAIGITIAAMIAILAITLLIRTVIGWWALLLMVVGIAAYFVVFSRWMNGKLKQMVQYYQKMGVNKKTYQKQLLRGGIKESNLGSYMRMWDIVYLGDAAKRTFLEKVLGY